MNKTSVALRREIIATCRQMNAMGINHGTAGNVSARVSGGILISPSAIDYAKLRPASVVFLSSRGKVEAGKGIVPSTEWRFHLDITNSRADVNAVVHTHSPYASIVAIRRQQIPAVHYMIAAAGGSTIRCAKYATYGTKELSRNALVALEGRTACLLANHGVIATGPSLAKALWLAKEIEVLAQQFVFTTLLGGPKLLAAKEIDRVMAKFADYGLKA